MNFDFESDLFQKLGRVINSEDIYTKLTANDEKYSAFIARYPADKIISLNLDQYSLGKNAQPENFCWWLERGLEKVLGRYSPGTSRGHILYKDKDGGVYRNSRLSDLTPEKALEYTLKIQSAIANAGFHDDITWIDNDEEIYKRAAVEDRVTIGDGRKLRLLSAYYPEHVLVISSSDHIKHFLLELGHSADEIPATGKPVERMLLLKKYYEEAKSRFNGKLTPYGFVRALYSEQLGIRPIKESAEELEAEVPEMSNNHPLNQILYGPPGTGKTYETVSLAVKIAAPEFYQQLLETNKDMQPQEIRNLVKVKFDELRADKRIVMTTFHQSFSYEDFIEGIRADATAEGSLKFKVEDGIFKQICEAASAKATTSINAPINLAGRKIWKMSLGNTLDGEDYIYQECLQNGYILLGYGDNIDFSECVTREQVANAYERADGEVKQENKDAVTSVYNFSRSIKKGDLIVVSDGNQKFRAIAEVTGDYELLGNSERGYYQQMRKVKWLQTFEPSKPKEQLFYKALSQMTLYELRPQTISMEKLANLLAPNKTLVTNEPYVLIIDEINRGNISRIFGELITLLEDSKRKGRPDAQEVTLPYSKEQFSVPENLYVIGTMNTADKSLAQLDLALRRRFDFIEKGPQPDLIKGFKVHEIDIGKMLETINDRIEVLLDSEHQIGHSYFMKLKISMTDNEREDILADIFRNNILPLLREYFFDDWSRISLVLNDQSKSKNNRFVIPGGKRSVQELFPQREEEAFQDRRSYINTEAFKTPEAYQGIL